MKPDDPTSLKRLKLPASALSALMVAGIASLVAEARQLRRPPRQTGNQPQL